MSDLPIRWRRTLDEWSKEVYTLAKDKGWWETPRSPLEIHMLIVSELAEATEAARKNGSKEPIYVEDSGKPEGELVELADAIIRILDYCESRGWDLEKAMSLKHEYNKTRGYRYGGKKY